MGHDLEWQAHQMHACQELISILEAVAVGRDSGHCEQDAQGSHYTAVGLSSIQQQTRGWAETVAIEGSSLARARP